LFSSSCFFFLLQEIGRAGRDGQLAFCHAFVSAQDTVWLRSRAHSDSVDSGAIMRLLDAVLPPASAHPLQPFLFTPVSLKAYEQLDVKDLVLETLLTQLELVPADALETFLSQFDGALDTGVVAAPESGPGVDASIAADGGTGTGDVPRRRALPHDWCPLFHASLASPGVSAGSPYVRLATAAHNSVEVGFLTQAPETVARRSPVVAELLRQAGVAFNDAPAAGADAGVSPVADAGASSAAKPAAAAAAAGANKPAAATAATVATGAGASAGRGAAGKNVFARFAPTFTADSMYPVYPGGAPAPVRPTARAAYAASDAPAAAGRGLAAYARTRDSAAGAEAGARGGRVRFGAATRGSFSGSVCAVASALGAHVADVQRDLLRLRGERIVKLDWDDLCYCVHALRPAHARELTVAHGPAAGARVRLDRSLLLKRLTEYLLWRTETQEKASLRKVRIFMFAP
jgi:hypothetical protein